MIQRAAAQHMFSPPTQHGAARRGLLSQGASTRLSHSGEPPLPSLPPVLLLVLLVLVVLMVILRLLLPPLLLLLLLLSRLTNFHRVV